MASDGIQETDVTQVSIRMARPYERPPAGTRVAPGLSRDTSTLSVGRVGAETARLRRVQTSRAKPSRAASVATHDRAAAAAADGVDLVVGAARRMVGQHQPPGPGLGGQGHGVLDGGVAVVGGQVVLVDGERGAVDEHVDAGRQGEGRLVTSAVAVGPSPHALGSWSGR